MSMLSDKEFWTQQRMHILRMADAMGRRASDLAEGDVDRQFYLALRRLELGRCEIIEARFGLKYHGRK